MPDESFDRGELLAFTAEIVAAYAGNNAVGAAELGGLIQAVFDTLVGLASDEPAVPVDLTPQAYRAKWGLKPDYPMVAPAYSAKRQALAKEIGLGRKPVPPLEPERKPKDKRRGKATA